MIMQAVNTSTIGEITRRDLRNTMRAGEATAKPPVLLVGTFLSGKLNHRSVCEELAARLSAADWRVITTSDQTGRARRLGDMLATVWRRRKDYSVANVDVFSGAAFVWAEAACWMLRRVGCPYVLTLHGGNLPNFARANPKRVARLLASAAIVTAPSGYLSEQMSAYRSDLKTLPNPLDVSFYDFHFRRQVRPELIWLRAFRNIYNPSLAPKVLARLVTEFPEVRLTMLGHDKADGSLEETRSIAKDLRVEAQLSLPGGVPKRDVPARLNAGDIFLNTTNVDNTPVSVLEAMACGLCVVSTNTGGLPYLLTHEENALLVPPDDAEAMASAVRRMLIEPELAAHLSRNGRKLVEGFDWNVMLPQWEELLSAVAGRHAP